MPWFDAHCPALRRDFRCLERRYRRSCDPAGRLVWIQHLMEMYSDFRSRDILYLEELIVYERSNPCRLWSTLPTCLFSPLLPVSLQNFRPLRTINWMLWLWRCLHSPFYWGLSAPSSPHIAAITTDWKPLLPDTLCRLILDSSFCVLDLLPPFIVLESIGKFLPVLLLLCNSSLAKGTIVSY